MTSLPSLNLLRTFDAVGRHLSFRVGAETLHITASAVSHQIRELEQQLGMPLFVRRHRGVSFTPEGATYHAAISRALADMRAATEALQAPPGAAPLRISAMPLVATEMLAPALNDFLVQWPALRVELLAETRSMDVPAGDTDIAIRFGYVLHEEAIPLVAASCTPVCAPALCDAVQADPAAAMGSHPLYGMTEYGDLWDRWLAAQGWSFAYRDAIRLNNYRGVLRAAAGDGLALGLLPIVIPLLEAGELAVPFPARRMPLAQFSLEVREAVRWRPEVVALVPWLRALLTDYARRTDEYFSTLAV